jgi:glyoxylase-like metal-dependent hydrolase (beta-lactamase superfamily II)
MTMRGRVLIVAIALIGALMARPIVAQRAAGGTPQAGDVHALKAQGNVSMLVGPGGNVTVQVGSDGVLVVDTQSGPSSAGILAAIRALSPAPIRYVVNTHYHADHTGGNEAIRKAGSTIAGGNVSFDIADAAQGAQVIAHVNVLKRLSAKTGAQPVAPPAAWPTSTFIGDDKKLFFNGEGVHVIHQPAAHTDGDSIVFFRRSDVISAGDIYITTAYPFIDAANGGTINGILAGLNRIIAMTVPRDKQEGGTMVIPGHGRISDEADVVEYRDMLTIVRDRVRQMKQKGWSLQQVRAARPTSDYDGRYGAASGAWTTDMFVDAVYQTLER